MRFVLFIMIVRIKKLYKQLYCNIFLNVSFSTGLVQHLLAGLALRS